MKIRSKNLGERRWLCFCTANGSSELGAFRQWLREQLTDAKLSLIQEGPEGIFTCEVRGGDLAAQTLLLMVWNNNK